MTSQPGESGNDSGISDTGEHQEAPKDVFDLTLSKMDGNGLIPIFFLSVTQFFSMEKNIFVSLNIRHFRRCCSKQNPGH